MSTVLRASLVVCTCAPFAAAVDVSPQREPLTRAPVLVETSGSGSVTVTRVRAAPGYSALMPVSFQTRGTVAGQVVLPNGLPVSTRMKLTLTGYRIADLTAYTDSKGRFSFPGINDGTYSIEVAGDPNLHLPVTQEVRVIYGAHPVLVITLREKPGAPSLANKVVATSEMDLGVPDAAKKEFDKGIEFSDKGRLKEAVESFKQAVAIYPNYLRARNNLGAQYLKLGQWGDAAAQFKAAVAIDANAFSPHLNLAIALIEQKKYSDALGSLNNALAIDGSNAAAHLYAGIASLGTDQPEQAERELSKALSLGGDKYALAHFFLGLLHMNEGKRDKAKVELNAYVQKAPDGEKVPRARQLLEKLKQ
jgi:Tfp pilus assembly protein PilF